MEFSKEENKLIGIAKDHLVSYVRMRKSKGQYDPLFAFILSSESNVYDGTFFDSLSQHYSGVCAERSAIANMVLAEGEVAKIDVILIASPVPTTDIEGVTPCGMCRPAIKDFATKKTSILVANFIRNDSDWTLFPLIKKFTIEQLYPFPATRVWRTD